MGRAVATLIRVLGDFDLAEEAVQEAWVVALERWPREGTPANPGAWITRVARNKAIDRLRRRQKLQGAPMVFPLTQDGSDLAGPAAQTLRPTPVPVVPAESTPSPFGFTFVRSFGRRISDGVDAEWRATTEEPLTLHAGSLNVLYGVNPREGGCA